MKKVGKCKRVGKYLHCPIEPKEKFAKESFRTKRLPKGRLLVVGCPRKKYDVKRKRCKVGVRAQKLLKPVKL